VEGSSHDLIQDNVPAFACWIKLLHSQYLKIGVEGCQVKTSGQKLAILTDILQPPQSLDANVMKVHKFGARLFNSTIKMTWLSHSVTSQGPDI